jgi:uncharacterized membrane protein YkvA (DUF1232 family)
MSNSSVPALPPASGGLFVDLARQAKLIFRLMGDRRVNFMLKLLPVASVAYLLLPADVVPIIPLDDALVLWLVNYLFVELCPNDVVAEHRAKLQALPAPSAPAGSPGLAGQGIVTQEELEIIDGEYREIEDSDIPPTA